MRRKRSITCGFDRARSLKRTMPVMSARVDSLSVPHHPVRWIVSSILGWAFLTALVAALRRRALKPTMARMSDQWLLSHGKEFHRSDY